MIPVTFSQRAIQEIQATIAAKNIPAGYGIRVGVRGSGCAGVSYILGFDQKSDKDMSFDIQGIPVYIEKKDMMYLLGIEVDFYEGSDARGFTFGSSHEKY